MKKINIELSKEQEYEVIKYANKLNISIEEFTIRAIELYIEDFYRNHCDIALMEMAMHIEEDYTTEGHWVFTPDRKEYD